MAEENVCAKNGPAQANCSSNWLQSNKVYAYQVSIILNIKNFLKHNQ